MNNEELLKKLIEEKKCECFDIGASFVPKTFKTLYDKVQYFEKNLPALSYVLTQSLNYIFSNGLTSSSVDEIKILKEFLYRENLSRATNFMELHSSISSCMIYGESGMRWYKDNIYMYKAGTFGAITSIVDGINTTLGYLVGTKKQPIKDIKINTPDMLRDVLSNDQYIFLKPEDFCVLRTDPSLPHGLCPFENDTLRLELLCEVYEKLLYDIRYDGPGRLLIRPRNNVETEDRGASQILSQSKQIQDKMNSDAKKEAERVGEELKNSKPDSVIMLSHGFDDKITHLPRVTKSTEFLSWLMKEEGVIVAEKLGMRPTILGLDDIAGNVSQEKIIDDTMLNSIVPIRELYSNQFSKFISNHLGISKVYFDKYELQQAPKLEDIRHKYSETIRNLSNAVKSLEHDGEASAVLENTISNLGSIMNESLFIDDNTLKEM